ncbi:MAG TPA: Rossmann-like and DUF2520 domain-containing protein [Longimicrobiales bacterium]|nr:Rossmann-like and DUF2520 domain-containing protein [Longimicrobiales bacterium]
MSERIVIIGPGRMGLALGSALVRSGITETLTFYGRSLEPPPHPLFEPEHGSAEYRFGIPPLPAETTVVILAVPDGALAEVAHELAALGRAPAGCAALHLAGALSADVLAPLHAVGYAVGSMHPYQTVADPWSSGDRLIGAAYGLGGDPAAMAAARRLVSALRGIPLVVPPAARPVYHASAVFASNYLIALVAVVVRLLGQVGLDEATAAAAALPLIRGTLDNLDHLGVAAALTGPIVRGDVDTVRLHLQRLSGHDRALYCALGRETLQLARAMGLDQDRAAAIESLLNSE